MDWSPTELQQEVASLAKQILRTSADPWPALAEAGLLDLEELPDICTFIEQVGRAGGSVPAFETLLLGGPARTDRHPPDAILTGALTEPGTRLPDTTSTTVVQNGRCTTTRHHVPAATVASEMVFAATDGLYAVELSACEVTPQQNTDGGVLGIVELDEVPVRRLGDCAAVLRWRQRADVGLAALQLGLSREALVMTAKYTSGREQFGKPIAMFQAVSQRAADGWIVVQAMELTMLQAAWRVEAGLSSEREVAIARYQASEGAHSVLATAQHLHGGMGFDRDYPLHRYFLCVKSWEFAAGGASAQLERLGAHLAGLANEGG